MAQRLKEFEAKCQKNSEDQIRSDAFAKSQKRWKAETEARLRTKLEKKSLPLLPMCRCRLQTTLTLPLLPIYRCHLQTILTLSAPHANDQTRNDIDESSFSSPEDSASEASTGHSSPTTSRSLWLELRRVDHYLKATELRV